MREFLNPQTPVFMVGSSYPTSSSTTPQFVTSYFEGKGAEREKEMVVMSMDELLPMSFGPEHLDMERK
jgi:cytidine deaminase